MAGTPDAVLERIPDVMCQQCGRAAATHVKKTVTGLRRKVCAKCMALVRGPRGARKAVGRG